jgi:hypothetical protein
VPSAAVTADWPAAATVGDILAVAGDLGGATAEFRRELRERPGRVESFAGLAVIHAGRVRGLERRLCTDHPEAVLALGERIRAATGHPPDLPALTAWIAAGGGSAWAGPPSRPRPCGRARRDEIALATPIG